MACATCDYYEADGDKGIECHGYPPVVLIGYDGKTKTVFPTVAADTLACSLYEST